MLMLSVIIHPQKSRLVLLPIKDESNIPLFYGILQKNTPKGARAGRFRIKHGNKEELRSPDEVIKLLRMADKILITCGDQKSEKQLKEMLNAYQLGYTNSCRLYIRQIHPIKQKFH